MGNVNWLFLLGYLVLTAVISYYNASVVGRWWTETAEIGGWPRFMSWMGAIMAVCGWFIVLLIPVTLVMYYGHLFEFFLGLVKIQADPEKIDMLVETIFDLSYLIIIFPVIGSGFAIWAESMAAAWYRRDAKSIGIAAWNTFAQTRNTYRAVRHLPAAARRVRVRTKNLGKGVAGLVYLALMILPIVISLGGAILITVLIMKAADNEYTYSMFAAQEG